MKSLSSDSIPSTPGSVVSIKAQALRWQDIRSTSRIRLTRTICVSALYLFAALLVGIYLLIAVEEIGRGSFVLMSWETEEIDVSWLKVLTWGYVGAGVVLMLGFLFLLLAVGNRLPRSLSNAVTSLPWIGGVLRSLSLGEWCESVYLSLLASDTYPDAFKKASATISHPGLRQWSGSASTRLDAGQSFLSVLTSIPIRDQPIYAASVLLQDEPGLDESLRCWQDATSECHELTRSRLHRTTQFITMTTLLVATLLASIALLSTVTLMRHIVEGISFWVF